MKIIEFQGPDLPVKVKKFGRILITEDESRETQIEISNFEIQGTPDDLHSFVMKYLEKLAAKLAKECAS